MNSLGTRLIIVMVEIKTGKTGKRSGMSMCMGMSTTKVKVHLIAEDATAVCTASEECLLKLKMNTNKKQFNLMSYCI